MGRTAGWCCGLWLGLMLVSAGCDDPKKPKPQPAATASAPVAGSSSAAASSSAAPAAPDPASAKKWTGTYDSKHVTLETPKKVKDFTWTKDDGTKATGKGQLSLDVKESSVSGDATGPLGAQKLTGLFEDETLRLQLLPADPTSAVAMTCNGVAPLKDGVIAGKLRCSGPKGVVVREVSFELKPAT